LKESRNSKNLRAQFFRSLERRTISKWIYREKILHSEYSISEIVDDIRIKALSNWSEFQQKYRLILKKFEIYS
jgi:hypothetical protein